MRLSHIPAVSLLIVALAILGFWAIEAASRPSAGVTHE